MGFALKEKGFLQIDSFKNKDQAEQYLFSNYSNFGSRTQDGVPGIFWPIIGAITWENDEPDKDFHWTIEISYEGTSFWAEKRGKGSIYLWENEDCLKFGVRKILNYKGEPCYNVDPILFCINFK